MAKKLVTFKCSEFNWLNEIVHRLETDSLTNIPCSLYFQTGFFLLLRKRIASWCEYSIQVVSSTVLLVSWIYFLQGVPLIKKPVTTTTTKNKLGTSHWTLRRQHSTKPTQLEHTAWPFPEPVNLPQALLSHLTIECSAILVLATMLSIYINGLNLAYGS